MNKRLVVSEKGELANLQEESEVTNRGISCWKLSVED